MKFTYIKIIVVALILMVSYVLLHGLVDATLQEEPDADVATRIYELARSLHYENNERGSFTIWVNGDIGEDVTARRTVVQGGDPLSDFELSSFDGNDALKPADMQGAYIINFWSSWCSVCRAEFALFDERIGDGSLTIPVIFVDTLDTQGAGRQFVSSLESPNNFTIAFDEDSKLFLSLWLTVNPDTVLVDADGNIQALQIGAMSDLSLEFFNEIALHPGVGSFDRLHPNEQPTETEVTPEPSATPG
jgi:thiol-disulfide isomerase/thioredoxin